MIKLGIASVLNLITFAIGIITKLSNNSVICKECKIQNILRRLNFSFHIYGRIKEKI